MDEIVGRVVATSAAEFPFYTLIVIGGKTYQRGVATEGAGSELIQGVFAAIVAAAKAKRDSDHAQRS